MPDDGSFFGSVGAPPFGVEQLQNVRAEQDLLGALLTNSGLVEALPAGFRVEHYGDPFHAEIHQAVVAVAQPKMPAALPVMAALFPGAHDAEGAKYIAGLLGSAASLRPGYVASLADVVTDMHRRRGLYAAAAEMQSSASATMQDGTTAMSAIGQAMTRLEGLLAAEGAGKPGVTLDDAMDAALDQADRVSSGVVPGISTGLHSIDAVLGGMEAGQMLVLAGRPGMGKSALGWQIAINVALSGRGVLAISLEMSAVELARRALCASARVPLACLKQGRHSSFAARLIEARQRLTGLPLTIEDGAGMTAAMIALKTRAARRRHGSLGLVMVDHLHIVRTEDADLRGGPTWAVGRVSSAMKRLAKDNDCPALVLAQLNRGVEGREDKRPMLSDLRHAGDIEQDADAVAFVYRPEYYLGAEPEQGAGETATKFSDRAATWHDDKARLRGKAEVIFSKVRDGAPGTVPLTFHHETTSFSEVLL